MRRDGSCATAAAVVALCTIGAACKRAPAPSIDAGARSEDDGKVLARVGDHTITLGDYAAALDHMDEFDRVRYQAPERRKELLAEMIDVMLLADEARAKGYDKDPVTQQELREILRDAMLKKARDGVPSPTDMPADQVAAYYEAHRADFRDPERRRVSAIVLATEGAAKTVLEAASKADAVRWGELVRAKSIEPDPKPAAPVDLAGDKGFTSPPGDPRGNNPRIPEEVRAALFQIPRVGDVGDHVVMAGGRFYVIRLANRTEAHERTLADAERSIRVKLTQEAISARQQALLDDLRKRFPVQVDEAALGRVRVDETPDASPRANTPGQ